MSMASPAFVNEDPLELPLELRQVRVFIRVVELGSIRRAAAELGVSASLLGADLERLESRLSAQLFRRTSNGGLLPTDAGFAFLRHAQLTLRHAVEAVEAARQKRLVGHVTVGLPPSIASVLGVPLLITMRERHPQLRLRVVESLSGHLAAMLDARQVDLALVARGRATRPWSVRPLIDERIYLLGRADMPGFPVAESVSLAELGDLPLVMPSGSHALRSMLDIVFERAGVEPHIALEIDGLALLMGAVRAGLGATLQPGAVVCMEPASELRALPITNADARRQMLIAGQSEDELSPAALATRVMIADVARELITSGRWPGVTLHEWNTGSDEP